MSAIALLSVKWGSKHESGSYPSVTFDLLADGWLSPGDR